MYFLNTLTADYVVQLGHEETSAARIIRRIKSSWINEKTRTVILEFAIYDPGTQMIVVVAYVHEFVGTGGFTVYENIHVLQLQITESLFFFLCQVLLFLFIAYYFVLQCVSIYFKRFSYFLNKWNWIEIFQLISVVVVVVCHIMTKHTLEESTGKFSLNPLGQISFLEPVFWSERETVATGILIFFTTIKLLKMNDINPHVVIFFDTCTRIWNFLPTFLVCSTILMIAFGHSGYIAFGSDSWEFSSVSRALMSQFLMLIGKPMPMSDLENANPILARLFAFAFLAFGSLMLVNLFIAMIMGSHSEVAGIDKNSERFELWNFMMERLYDLFYGNMTANEPSPPIQPSPVMMGHLSRKVEKTENDLRALKRKVKQAQEQLKRLEELDEEFDSNLLLLQERLIEEDY